MKNTTALKELLFKMADDQLIMGHRNSQWTGLAPLLEEDMAFASLAQDQVARSQSIYQILNELGEPNPDQTFMRGLGQFRNCQFVELPNNGYDFSIVRHFLFENAESLRFALLSTSTFEPLKNLAIKIKGEIKFHTTHANTVISQLGSATQESIDRLQKALDFAAPYALGMFERSHNESELISEEYFSGEGLLKSLWIERIENLLTETKLKAPDFAKLNPVLGGRYGDHSNHLQPLLDQMSEVIRIDPSADW